MDQRRSRRQAAMWAAPVALLAATAAACGSSSGSSAPSTAASSAPAAPAATSATFPAATVTTAQGPLGTFLTSGDGRTLYLFEKDTSTTSTCTGTCAVDWPPLVTTTSPQAAGQAQANMLGTSHRPDGTTQVTYAGHPVYLFMGDQGAGSTAGQGVDAFGAEWYIMAPSGQKIEGTASTSGSTTSSNSSGGSGGY